MKKESDAAPMDCRPPKQSVCKYLLFCPLADARVQCCYSDFGVTEEVPDGKPSVTSGGFNFSQTATILCVWRRLEVFKFKVFGGSINCLDESLG